MTRPENYQWPAVGDFRDRDEELAALESWWSGDERMPIAMYGRRRTGKSWLLRRFAHGKPAVVLVARQLATTSQLDEFAAKLEPALGVRPSVSSVADLVRLLYRLGHDRRIVAVIDEFPYLLPRRRSAATAVLTEIAAVMEEERDTSQLKLVLCGSLIGEMESLLAERGPLHGRLRPLQIHPVTFDKARQFLPGLDPAEQFRRFAVAGGMPRYLAVVADRRPLSDIVCTEILSPNAALFDEGRIVLEQELTGPKVYFALLEALSTGDKDSNELTSRLRIDAAAVAKYLSVLAEMHLVERSLPAGATRSSRTGRWHLRDPFFRFWFRYVRPFQDDLESGLPAATLFETEIEPTLPQHTSHEFESFCRQWTRRSLPVSRVAAWWGPAQHQLRRDGIRSTEEIDIVATARGRVTAVGEARWRSKPTDVDYLADIDAYKLPALRQSGLTVAKTPQILLFSLSGYTERLRQAASAREDVTLVDVREALVS